jgi:transcriptional regulator with XRE-family HTH domain
MGRLDKDYTMDFKEARLSLKWSRLKASIETGVGMTAIERIEKGLPVTETTERTLRRVYAERGVVIEEKAA